MSVTTEQIDSFHRFATNRLKNGSEGLSMDELYDEWRTQHFSPEEIHENVLAVRAAIRDMENGDTGQDADDVIAELRDELGLGDE